jgi:hypothetical protein
MNQGIKLLTQEDNEANNPYRVGNVISLPALKDIPYYQKPNIPESWIFNQNEFDPTDICGGCALAIVSALQEGTPLDPHFHWMMARQRAGMSIPDFGVSNRDLAMSAVKVGSLKRIQSPYTFKDGRDTIADPSKWDIVKLSPLAKPQIKGSVVWIKAEGGYDAFDVFRASVTKFNAMYGKPHGAVFGLTWNYSNYDIDEVSEVGTGHDTAVFAGDGDHAWLLNSMGTGAGVRGWYRISRKVFNRWCEAYGAFIPIDATQEQIKSAVENGTKLDNYWMTNIIIALYKAIIEIKRQIIKQS